MAIKKVCVVGPGAIGGMIAVKMAEAGFEVSALARPRRAEAINQTGLTLLSAGKVVRVRPRAAERGADLGPQDLVIVTVKSNYVADVAPELAALNHAGTPIVFAMNGLPWWFFDGFGGPLADKKLTTLDPNGVLAREVPRASIVWGVVNYSASLLDDGTIQHTKANELTIGRPGDDALGLASIVEALARAGFDCKISDNIRRDIWRKLAINVVCGPASALAMATLGEMYDEPLLLEAMAAMLEEMRALAAKLGIESALPDLQYLKGAPVRTSTLQDLERGRALELAAISEAAVEVGALAGVPMPLTRMSLGLIRVRARTAGLSG